MRIDVYVHSAEDGALEDINRKLDILLGIEGEIVADLSALTAEVQSNTDLDASIIAVVDRIAAELEAAKTDPAAVQALVDQLRTNNASISAAVTANTPADTGDGTVPTG